MSSASVISAASSGTSASSGSRRGTTKQYRVVAQTSQVDESLFGSGKTAVHAGASIEEQARLRNLQRKGRKNNNKKQGKETVQVITKDLIRNLVVPQNDPSGKSAVIRRGDFERLKNSARVLTEAEKLAQLQALKAHKEAHLNAVQARKEELIKMDLIREKNEQLTELELERREKAEYLQRKANQQRQEQEDEIKHLNELILNAKCHAIRDEQLEEKKKIIDETAAEEKRLDLMMESARIKELEMSEEIEKKRKDERIMGAMKIMQQIQENEEERLLELERKDQENKSAQAYLDKLCEEEAETLLEKRKEQQRLREDLNKCNDDIIRRKKQLTEHEKLVERQVQEYQQKKTEREAAFEREQEKLRIEKEKEVAVLRVQQERVRDEAAGRDALRARRAQEQAEREWRLKEAEEARLKALTEESLKKARSEQTAQKEHFLAVQAQRERADFERVLRAQKEVVAKELEKVGEKLNQRDKYADEVRLQMREKNQQRVQERQLFFEDGVKLNDEAQERRNKLDEIKRMKLEELRALGLQDKYVAQVGRKAGIVAE